MQYRQTWMLQPESKFFQLPLLLIFPFLNMQQHVENV